MHTSVENENTNSGLLLPTFVSHLTTDMIHKLYVCVCACKCVSVINHVKDSVESAI